LHSLAGPHCVNMLKVAGVCGAAAAAVGCVLVRCRRPREADECRRQGDVGRDMQTSHPPSPGLTDSSRGATPSPIRHPDARRLAPEVVQRINSLRKKAQLAHDQVCKFFAKTEEEVQHDAVKHMLRRAFWDQLNQQLQEEPSSARERLRGLLGELQDMFARITPHPVYQQQVKEVFDAEQFDACLEEKMDEAVAALLLRSTKLLHSIEPPASSPLTAARSQELARALEEKGLAATMVPILSFLFERVETVKEEVSRYRVQQVAPQLRDKASELARELTRAEVDEGIIDFTATRQWLHRIISETNGIDLGTAAKEDGHDEIVKIVAEGVLKMVRSPTSVMQNYTEGTYPETLRLDIHNLFHFQNLVQRVALLGCILNLSVQLMTQRSALAGLAPPPQDSLLPLKEELSAVLQHPAVSLPLVQRVVLQGVKQALDPLELGEQLENALASAVSAAVKTEHTVYAFCQQRILEALSEGVRDFVERGHTVSAEDIRPVLAKANMAGVAAETAEAAGQLGRLIKANVFTYVEYYRHILTVLQ